MTRWSFPGEHPGLEARLADHLDVSPIMARLLVNRGVRDLESGRAFLNPTLSELWDPFLLRDMDAAADRVHRAIRAGERILVFGDYDVDGVSGTTLLLHFLRFLRADVVYHIPNRLLDGYGLGIDSIEAIVVQGARLVITVDNGVSAHEAIARLAEMGIDTIVCDHHQVPDVLPPALAVLNHQRPDCEYPNKQLCGVGVAFKLCWAVGQRLSQQRKVSSEFREFLLNAMAWVCLGTITDVVSLTGENRVIARYGLWALENTKSPGLKALLEVTGIGNRRVRARDIGFKIGPRINAAGRLGDAPKAIRLLTTDSYEEALTLAKELEENNLERRRIQDAIFEQARERLLGDHTFARRRTIVLADDEWHLGVVGIVAAKLVEEFWRPSILIALDGETGRGSARSIPGFNLHAAMGQAADTMISFGGHMMAAGLHIHRGRVPELQERLERVAADVLTEPAERTITIDAEVMLSQMTHQLISELKRLAPHGTDNPEPVLAASDVRLVGNPRRVGRHNEHLQFAVHQDRITLRAIAYGMGEAYDRLCATNRPFAIAFSPIINTWGDRSNVELVVRDLELER